MINPYTRSDRAIATDLKVFIGKRSEISVLETQNKIVDKKWYLAWDTGEFFVANSLRKLVRYGGTSNTLSKEEIEQLLHSYTDTELSIIRAQLTDAAKKYYAIENKVDVLNTKVDNTINEIENNASAHILAELNRLIENGEFNTYSKEEVDNSIAQNKTEILTTVSNLYTTKTDIDNYYNKEESDMQLREKLSFNTGENIHKLSTLKQSGYYFCISNSSDESFQTGHTYRLMEGVPTDITAEGSGVSHSSPTIELSINGNKKIIKGIGSDLTEDLTLSYNITNVAHMHKELSFYVNKELIQNMNIPLVESGSFIYNPNIVNANIGRYKYTLSGEDDKGKIIKSECEISIIAPIYYGTSFNLVLDDAAISAGSTLLSENIENTYTFTSQNGQYLFIAVPSNLKMKKATMNGFEVPFENEKLIELDFAGYKVEYKYYMSSMPAEAGVFNIDII